MNEIFRLLNEDPQRVLDRLVDGELSNAEQRQLLTALDEEPGGWRRCALAFIEAGAWRDALGEVARPSSASTVPAAVQLPAAPRKSALAGWSWLAVAASIVAAFACGKHWTAASAPGPIAKVTVPASAVPATNDAAGAFDDTGGFATPAHQWHTVQLNFDDAVPGESDTVEVPCLDVSRMDAAELQAGQLDPEWLARQASALPAAWLQTLRETGYTVQTRQELWPVDMADGRHVVVPVEQVELRYLGGNL